MQTPHTKLLGLMLAVSLFTGCREKVESGNVGIKVHLYGSSKGVEVETVGVGVQWINPFNEELHRFPVWEQNPKYAMGQNDAGDPIPFQTLEGMTASADFSVTYNIKPENAAKVFQRYRQGVEEINKGPLRNLLRDAINEVASDMPVEEVYGEKKAEMLAAVQKLLASRAEPAGISVTKVSLLGSIQLPPEIMASINAKLGATQKAQQRENELRQAKAEAEKEVATAEGHARARTEEAEGEAKAILVQAEAQAKANRALAQSLTSELVEYEKAKKWNGALPSVTGGNTPFLNLPSVR